MSYVENPEVSVKEAKSNITGDFLWGVEQIAPVVGLSPRQGYHMLAAGQIKSARKIGGKWFANRAALLKEFGA